MTRPAWTTVALGAVMMLLTACGAASDTPTGPSSTVVTPASTVVTPPAPTTGVVQGFVRIEAYLGLVFSPEAPLADVQVLVTEGPGAGQSVITDTKGAYRLELPPGPFRLRWSSERVRVEPRDSNPGAVIAGATTTVDTVVLPRSFEGNPEWSVSGIVSDRLGNPVAGVDVDASDGVAWYVGLSLTDAAGRFRIASKRPHPDWLHMSTYKEGYPAKYITLFCGPSCALTVDFRLEVHVREWLDGPSTMQVGDVAAVSLVGEYADGTRSVERPRLVSSNLAVVQVVPLAPPYDKMYVKAIAAGTATLRQYLGSQVGTLTVRVVQ
jgi:hypothetical protein